MRVPPGICGSLAQPVEQRTFNPLVASSNLARPTNKKQYLANFPICGGGYRALYPHALVIFHEYS